MNTKIGYAPETVVDGSEGNASELWNRRISALSSTREVVDEIEWRLFADIIPHTDISRV